MNVAFVDTDVIIRLLTGDDLQKQASAAALFEQVEAGTLTLAGPDTIIADSVYVLSSARLYNVPRSEIREMLTTLIRLPNFRIRNRRALLRALDLYASSNLDFSDAFLVASMEQLGSQVLYSYDADFDRVPGVRRVEP